MPIPRPKGSVTHDNTGKVVLVSGGANGIGRSICDSFAASGATVVCLDVDEASAAALPAEIDFVRGDTSVETDCQNAVSFCVEQHGGLDILVNNAATINLAENSTVLDVFLP